MVKGNQVVIYGDLIRENSNIEVKLAQTGWYLVNLYNSGGIPAAPAQVKEMK